MHVLSWATLLLCSSVISVAAIAEPKNGLSLKHDDLRVRQNDDDDSPVRTSRRTSRRTTATARVSNTRRRTSTRETRTTPRTTREITTEEPTSTEETSTEPTTESSTETSAESSTESSTSTSTTSESSLSSTSSASTPSGPQPTGVRANPPEESNGNKVSIAGIVAGVLLGLAALVGIVWIAVAKFREKKRARASRDDEAKPDLVGGFGAAGARNTSEESTDGDTLLGGKSQGSRTSQVKMTSLTPMSRAYSFQTNDPASRQTSGGTGVPQENLQHPHGPEDYNVHNPGAHGNLNGAQTPLPNPSPMAHLHNPTSNPEAEPFLAATMNAPNQNAYANPDPNTRYQSPQAYSQAQPFPDSYPVQRPPQQQYQQPQSTPYSQPFPAQPQNSYAPQHQPQLSPHYDNQHPQVPPAMSPPPHPQSLQTFNPSPPVQSPPFYPPNSHHTPSPPLSVGPGIGARTATVSRKPIPRPGANAFGQEARPISELA